MLLVSKHAIALYCNYSGNPPTPLSTRSFQPWRIIRPTLKMTADHGLMSPGSKRQERPHHYIRPGTTPKICRCIQLSASSMHAFQAAAGGRASGSRYPRSRPAEYARFTNGNWLSRDLAVAHALWDPYGSASLTSESEHGL